MVLILVLVSVCRYIQRPYASKVYTLKRSERILCNYVQEYHQEVFQVSNVKNQNRGMLMLALSSEGRRMQMPKDKKVSPNR